MTIYLVTSANGPYMPRIKPYLRTLQFRLTEEVQPICITVDCDAPDWAFEVSRVRFIRMSAEENYGTSESTSVEHGSFLWKIPGDADDLFIYTNGDLVMQVPLPEWYLWQLHNFPHRAVSGVWNAGWGDTLGDEARRLQPKVSSSMIWARFPNHEVVPCFNMGVYIARRAIYEDLYAAYMGMWDVTCSTFGHYARQQWLVNYAAFSAGAHFIEMTPGLHAQGHYGLPHGVTLTDEGQARYMNWPAVWRHKL